MTRDKHTIKFTKPVLANKEGLQLATPEIIARYISKRLKTNIIADLGCGIGGQVIFFAKECKKVYAVERNPEKLEYARKNCSLYNVNNVEFVLGDALSQEVKERVHDAEIIFSDPARPSSEKKRTLENLEPPIIEILKIYSDVTPDMAFHVPPQIPPERIGLDCECEYLSLQGQLNRLTLYFGSLKSCERSAVVIPGEAKLCSFKAPAIKSGQLSEYVYEPEPSISKAGLLNELARKITESDNEIFYYKSDERRILLTSSKLMDSIFFKDRYQVLANIKMDIPKLKDILRIEKARSVVLRFDIEPEKYWEMRKMREEGVTGTRTLHVFRCGDDVLVCEKIKNK